MKRIKPTYYDTFACIASACPDSCCKGWTLQIDDAAARYYSSIPGELGDKLRHHLVQEQGETILALEDDGRCPMWRADGLCRLHAELGESALCDTCRDFPRLHHDYGDFVEVGLELSCPVAAKILLARRDCSITVETLPGGESPEYDTDAMAVLRTTRQVILDFLANTALSAGDALAVTLLYGYAVQAQLDGGEPAVLSPDLDLAQAKKLSATGDMAAVFDFYSKLEVLDSAWLQRLQQPLGGPWLPEHLAMARYLIERYWLQAVSDYDLVSRVKLTVLSCLVVKTLGGDVYETAQRYSKEIENDADNLETILDATYTAPAFTDRGLLELLLTP